MTNRLEELKARVDFLTEQIDAVPLMNKERHALKEEIKLMEQFGLNAVPPEPEGDGVVVQIPLYTRDEHTGAYWKSFVIASSSGGVWTVAGYRMPQHVVWFQIIQFALKNVPFAKADDFIEGLRVVYTLPESFQGRL